MYVCVFVCSCSYRFLDGVDGLKENVNDLKNLDQKKDEGLTMVGFSRLQLCCQCMPVKFVTVMSLCKKKEKTVDGLKKISENLNDQIKTCLVL